jgi:hypothetical protein
MDNKGSFGLPSTCDEAILVTQHNRDVYKHYEKLCKCCAKVKNKGTVLSVDYLAQCSLMARMCSVAFNAAIGTKRTKEGAADYRIYMAKKIVDEVNSGQWD